MEEAEYQLAIPECCSLQTTKDHLDVLMLCWGITHRLVQEQGPQYCDSCELRKAAIKKEITG